MPLMTNYIAGYVPSVFIADDSRGNIFISLFLLLDSNQYRAAAAHFILALQTSINMIWMLPESLDICADDNILSDLTQSMPSIF